MINFDHIEDTGEWWAGQKWSEEAIKRQDKYSLEEVRAGVGILKNIFTAEWTRNALQNPFENLVSYYLIDQSDVAFRFLMDLSKMIRALKDAEGFKAVQERLKTTESESAFMEMELAYIFCKKGINVKFPKSLDTKTPDVIASCFDYPLAIECKRLKKEKWEIWADRLHNAVHYAVTAAKPDRKFKIQLELHPRVSDIHLQHDKYPILNDAIKDAIVTQIKNTVEKILEANILPMEFEITGLVSGKIFPEDANVLEVTRGVEISSVAKLRRILTNGFFEASNQLPRDTPGIIAIYSEYLPDPLFARLVLDAITRTQREEFKHITALIVFPLQTLFQRTAPQLFENKNSFVKLSDLSCFLVIRDSFKPEIC